VVGRGRVFKEKTRDLELAIFQYGAVCLAASDHDIYKMITILETPVKAWEEKCKAYSGIG
jgi:hypothetical protein